MHAPNLRAKAFFVETNVRVAEFNLTYRAISNAQPGHVWLEVRSSLHGQITATWDLVWAAGAWSIWRERNKRLFTNK